MSPRSASRAVDDRRTADAQMPPSTRPSTDPRKLIHEIRSSTSSACTSGWVGSAGRRSQRQRVPSRLQGWQHETKLERDCALGRTGVCRPHWCVSFGVGYTWVHNPVITVPGAEGGTSNGVTEALERTTTDPGGARYTHNCSRTITSAAGTSGSRPCVGPTWILRGASGADRPRGRRTGRWQERDHEQLVPGGPNTRVRLDPELPHHRRHRLQECRRDFFWSLVTS